MSAGVRREDAMDREEELRERMVREQISARGIRDERVLEAFRRVPRHCFVSGADPRDAYADHPLPIGEGQTISQPYIVAEMCALCGLTGDERVLEIGTGSGYEAAILAHLAAEVYTIERIPSIYQQARSALSMLGYENVQCLLGDGFEGYKAAMPYDVVLLSAAPEEVPQSLVVQLRDGGVLVAPIGGISQELLRVEKRKEGLKKSRHGGVRFVPMKHGTERD
jgi:protein-L-isoaspartate(D-aspartate) O-methyltransferase